MREPWRERLAIWVCARIGHRLDYSQPPMLNGAYWCKRCGRSAQPRGVR